MIAQTTHGQLAEYLRNFYSRISKTTINHAVKLEAGQYDERDLAEICAALEDLQTGIKYALNCAWRPADAPEYSIPTPQPYACSDDLAALLENLRANQSLFFRTKNGTIDHANAFQESKRLEKELDQFLKRRKEEKEKLPDLFSL